MSFELMTYTIYFQPEVWPHYRVRAFHTIRGVTFIGDVLGVAASLELARLIVPVSAEVAFERSPKDDPEIVETWM